MNLERKNTKHTKNLTFKLSRIYFSGSFITNKNKSLKKIMIKKAVVHFFSKSARENSVQNKTIKIYNTKKNN